MKFQLRNLDALAVLFGEISLEAGSAILQHRGTDGHVITEADGSPVTSADLAADEIICRRLAAELPGIPIVSEESAASAAIDGTEPFFLVDPLDGTREFVAGRNEFTVNIGLIENGKPTVGAVYAPALSLLYLAGAHAYAATVLPGDALPPLHEMRLLKARLLNKSGWCAVASRSHLDRETQTWSDQHPVTEITHSGSSLKFCTIAEASADVYPRLAPTMEWDTAAGHAVLSAAGGYVVNVNGTLLRYGKPEYRNGSFIAWGRSPDERNTALQDLQFVAEDSL